MDMNTISNVTSAATYATNAYKKTAETETKTKSAYNDVAAVYEKSDEKVSSSKTDRSEIVKALKADLAAQQQSLIDIVKQTISKQGQVIGTADDVWRMLASGDFTIDEAAKAKAQEAISEDGYWGVDKTSSRIVDFAIALSGGDESKADKMIEAFKKGYKEATKTWGKDLPDISSKTYDAVMEKMQAWKDGTYTS